MGRAFPRPPRRASFPKVWKDSFQGLENRRRVHFYESETPMAKSNQPHRHHTTPQAYLKQFCIPETGRVHWLDIQSLEMHEQSINQIMHRHDYYRQPHAPDGIDEFVFEKKIGEHYESKIKRLIDGLINDPAAFTSEDMQCLLEYIELQRLRVPAQHERAIQELKFFAENQEVPEEIAGDSKGKVKDFFTVQIDASYRFNYMMEMLADGVVRKCLYRMKWNVCAAPEGFFFVTSDNPVVVFNPAVPYGIDADIDQIGSEVIYPLTSSWCLYLTHPEKETAEPSDLLCRVPKRPMHEDCMNFVHRDASEKMCNFFNAIISIAATRFVASCDRQILCRIKERLGKSVNAPKPE